MSFLEDVVDRFRLEAKQAPSTVEEITALKQFSPILVPSDYLALISEASELEFSIDGGEYIRIWGALGCMEMNEAYSINENIPGSLAIGDNEGGAALIIVPNVPKPGLYLISFGCLDVDDGKYIASSLTELLINGEGVDVLIS